MGYSVAAPVERKIKPAFIVKKLEGTRKEVIIGWDAKGKRTPKEVEVPAGYLVKFPHRGHSIRVKNDADLARLGFDQTIPLLDADGEPVGEIDNIITDADGDE
jgi:hypothetical protein